jgi:hypothetical protein
MTANKIEDGSITIINDINFCSKVSEKVAIYKSQGHFLVFNPKQLPLKAR